MEKTIKELTAQIAAEIAREKTENDAPDLTVRGVGRDLAGYLVNLVFPPDYKRNGSLLHGYRTDTEETLFYDFAVQGYDLQFKYDGRMYHFLTDDDGVWLSDEHFTAKLRRFESGNDVLKHFILNGKPLLNRIGELEECEPM